MSIEETCTINLGVTCTSSEGGTCLFKHQDETTLTLRNVPEEANIKVGDKFYIFLHRTDNQFDT